MHEEAEEYLWPANTHKEEEHSPANAALPADLVQSTHLSPAIKEKNKTRLYLDSLSKKYPPQTAAVKQCIIELILECFAKGAEYTRESRPAFYNAFGSTFHSTRDYPYLYELFSLIKRDMQKNQIAAFIDHVTTGVTKADLGFCLEYFGPYYDEVQLPTAVNKYLKYLESTYWNDARADSPRRSIAILKYIFLNLIEVNKGILLDYLLNKLDNKLNEKKFNWAIYHSWGSYLDAVSFLCACLPHVNQEYREKIMARFVRIINGPSSVDRNADLRLLVFAKLLSRAGSSFSPELRVKMIKRSRCRDTSNWPQLKFLELMPSFSEKEQEIVTQYFLAKLESRTFRWRAPILKALKPYFTDVEKYRLRKTCERHLLENADPDFCYELIELLGFYLPSFIPRVQNEVIDIMVSYVIRQPCKELYQQEAFCKALLGRITDKSPHFPFFIQQLLPFISRILNHSPRLLQDRLGLGGQGVIYNIRTLIEKAALRLPCSILPRLAIDLKNTEQAKKTKQTEPEAQVKAFVKYMYFYVKSNTMRAILSPSVPITDLLDAIDAYLHLTPYKIRLLPLKPTQEQNSVLAEPYGVGNSTQNLRFFPSGRIHTGNSILIEPTNSMTI